jgi:cytochrome b pre-mRNA-processing protein 3
MNIATAAQAARSTEEILPLLHRIFRTADPRDAWRKLYDAIVARARDPHWYRDGSVPDTIDGRFDMLAALTALVLLRFEALGDEGRTSAVLLTELFVADMDSSLREIGIGEYVVGKHIGRMMSALGGRLGALRAAGPGGDLGPAVRRNIFHESPPSEEAVALVAARLADFRAGLGALALADLAEGRLP